MTTELVDSSHIVFMEDDGASDEMIEDAESILSCRSFASGQVYTIVWMILNTDVTGVLCNVGFYLDVQTACPSLCSYIAQRLDQHGDTRTLVHEHIILDASYIPL